MDLNKLEETLNSAKTKNLKKKAGKGLAATLATLVTLGQYYAIPHATAIATIGALALHFFGFNDEPSEVNLKVEVSPEIKLVPKSEP